METCSILSPTQRYAAGALFALAVHQSQIHQTRISSDPFPRNEGTNVEVVNTSKTLLVSDNPELCILENYALLWPVFSLLGVDDQTWHGLQETADEEYGSHEQKSSGQEKLSNNGTKSSAEPREIKHNLELHVSVQKEASMESENEIFEKPIKEANLISYQMKVTILYAILSACVADTTEDDKKGFLSRKGYELFIVWFSASWLDGSTSTGLKSSEAMEIRVAYSFMDTERKENAKDEDSKISESDWDKWKRGGIIGAAALTGGGLMAVTGGLAAPAIAEGLGALVPTLGSLVPVIGSGFAAAATATGSIAGSVAVAASFGGMKNKFAAGSSLTGNKITVRIGSLEEFELKEIGGNNQGLLVVEICISGLAFVEENFVIPWEVLKDNSESLLSQGLAGILPVDLPGVENVDVTQIIEGHSSYLGMTGQILQQLEMGNCCVVFRNGHENTDDEKSTAT